MFSPIYLRLEGNVPHPPKMKKLDFGSRWHFGSGWCTPPPNWNCTNMNAMEKKHFKWGQQVHYKIYPLPLFQYLILFYAWTENLWISISNGYLKIWISGFQITVILDLDDVPHSPPQKYSQVDWASILAVSCIFEKVMKSSLASWFWYLVEDLKCLWRISTPFEGSQ